GASTGVLVNAEDPPLERRADVASRLEAGPERAVAATKSVIASLAAIAALAAEWADDAPLREAVARLPELLARAPGLDWSAIVPMLRDASSAFVIGRGPGLGAAQEAALKRKETSALHAEAFSAPEARDGPEA